jgi:hypothetical protein
MSFKVDNFLHDVASEVDKDVEEGINNMRTTLKDEVKSKKMSGVKDAALEDSCEELKQNIKRKFDGTLKKFDVYCKRNLFVKSKAPRSSSAESDDTSKLDDEISRLREESLTLLKSLSDTNLECSAAEDVLKDLKASLFNLQMGAQVFDTKELGSLNACLATLVKDKRSLEQQCGNASELVKKMIALPQPASTQNVDASGKQVSTPASSQVRSDVIVGDKVEVTRLTRSIRGTK